MLPRVIVNLIAEYVARCQIKPWILERAPRLRGKCRPSGVMRCRWEHMLESESGDACGDRYYSSDYDEDIPEDEYYNFRPNGNPFDIIVDGNRISSVDYNKCICCSFSDPWLVSNVYLCANPRGEEYMRGRWIYWNGIGMNPADWAIDELEKISPEYWQESSMCKNTNPRIIPMLKKLSIDELDLHWLTQNPIMVPWLRENPKLISSVGDLLKNPAAESLLREMFGESVFFNAHIWSNPAPWAVAEIKKHTFLGPNTLGFMISENQDPWVIDHVTSITEPQYWTDQEREALYRNPNPRALNFVRDHPELFKLSPMIWSNPEIFDLVPDPNIVAALESI